MRDYSQRKMYNTVAGIIITRIRVYTANKEWLTDVTKIVYPVSYNIHVIKPVPVSIYTAYD